MAGCLYTVERQQVEPGRYSYSLAVYRVHRDSGDITLLDRMELEVVDLMWPMCPRVERHSGRVFVPCWDNGVAVARLDHVDGDHGDRLVRERTLFCVRNPCSVDGMSPDTVYVCNHISESVHVVDVRHDRITSTLEQPETLRGELPWGLAVLGDSVMVSYSFGTLVVYRHGNTTPIKVIPISAQLKDVSTVSTDCHSNFLITDSITKSVLVMGDGGNVRHIVNMDTISRPRNCAVVNKQLWVGCLNGDIVIMSSQG